MANEVSKELKAKLEENEFALQGDQICLSGFNPDKYPVKMTLGDGTINVCFKSDSSLENEVEFEKSYPLDSIDKLKSGLYDLNFEIFSQVVEKFKNSHMKQKDSTHVKFSVEDNSYLSNKLKVKGLVDEFTQSESKSEEELKALFKSFWKNEFISAVQQGANAENILKTENIIDIQKSIKSIIEVPVKDDFNAVLDEIQKYPRMRNSAVELYYSYHLNPTTKVDFPNFNSTNRKGIEMLERLLGENFIGSEDDKTKMDKIINEFELHQYPKIQTKNNESSDSYLPKFYVLDQLFNLIIKVDHKVMDYNENNEEQKKMYEQALLINNWIGLSYFPEIIDDLEFNKNVIYTGAPGTGKTYRVLKTVKYLTNYDKSRYEFVQFHPSFSYEDFIEGIRPTKQSNEKKDSIQFELKNGIFREFCKEAKKDEGKYISDIENRKGTNHKYSYFFIIDEINRAELSRVFGELLFGLEYRGKEHTFRTQYSNLRNSDEVDFYIPENVYVIGTMNDIDRSIDSFDIALRRRFNWIHTKCDYDVISQMPEISELKNKQEYIIACKSLNDYICDTKEMSRIYEIGHSYFMKISDFIRGKEITNAAIGRLFDYKIKPLLREYLRTNYKINELDSIMKDAKSKFSIPKGK